MNTSERSKLVIYSNHFAGVAVVFFVALSSTLLNYLSYNGYPLLTPEIGILFLFLLLVSLGAGILYKFLSNYGKYILISLMIILTIELISKSSLPTHYLLLLVPILVIFVFKEKTLPIFGIICGTILISAPFQSQSEQKFVADTSLAEPSKEPFILHLILDAHIGIEGLGSFEINTDDIQKEMREFYINHGFSLYGGSYSKYFHTINSIPEILSYETEVMEEHYDWQHRALKNIKYFELLRSKGYRINVYQNESIDYCKYENVQKCSEYTVSNPLAVKSTSLSAIEKAKIIGSSYIRLSNSAIILATVYDIFIVKFRAINIQLPLLMVKTRSYTSAIYAHNMIDDLIGDIKNAQPGEVYFAHILLPHFPYAYGSDCQLKQSGNWNERRHFATSKKLRETAYVEQIRCVIRKVDTLLKNLSISEAKDNNIVIIHGDHGARITNTDPFVRNIGLFNSRDLISSYSTIFAVRHLKNEPAYIPDYIAVDRLFSGLVTNNFKSISVNKLKMKNPYVILEDNDWRPMQKTGLPEEWPKNK